MAGKKQQRDAAKGAPSLTRLVSGSEPRREFGAAGFPAAGFRAAGFWAVGAAASKLAAPIIAKRGGGILVRLKAEWEAIIGPDWAVVTWPTALARNGVLKLRAASAVALELQHRAPLLIERINLFLGRQVITRLALMQGPLPLAPPPTGPLLRALSLSEANALNQRLVEIADPQLRAALARLGSAVIGGEG
jgi:hypothetical protein